MDTKFQQEVKQLCSEVAQLQHAVEQMALRYAAPDKSVRELSWYLGISVAVTAAVVLLFSPLTLELVGVR